MLFEIRTETKQIAFYCTEGKGSVRSLQYAGNVSKPIRTEPHPLHTKLGGVVSVALLNAVDDFKM